MARDFIDGKGDNPLSHLWTSLHFGDYMAYYLAMAYGVNPAPVELLEDLSAREYLQMIFFSLARAARFGDLTEPSWDEAQVQAVVSGIEAMLRAMPRVWPDVVISRFASMGLSSLDVEVLWWFQTSDVNEFRDLRQEALLGIMKVVREAGTDFAYPTQTIRLNGAVGH